MTSDYAPWVEPIAARWLADRAALISFARAFPSDAWLAHSAVEGWSNRDVLWHLAGGNDELVQIMLRAVVTGQPLAPGTFDVDTDAANERGVTDRRAWSVERMIDQLEEDGEEMRGLLSQLRSEHEGSTDGTGGWTLGQFLHIVHKERHDRLHMGHFQPPSEP